MWSETGVPWVAIGDMTRSSVVVETDRSVSSAGIVDKRLPIGQSGTLLFAMYASLGAIAVLGIEASWNQAILGIEPLGDETDLRFVRYWLEHLRPGLTALARSNTQDNLNAEQVGSLPFPVMSVAQQAAIADFLDGETARIDALIAKKRRMVELSTCLFRMFRWSQIAIGLNGFDGSYRWTRKPASSAWKTVRLRYVVERPLGGVWGDVPGEGQVDVACYRVADFDRWLGTAVSADPTIRSIDLRQLNRLELRPGDLLLEKSGGGELQPVGFVARFDGSDPPSVCSNFVSVLRPRPGTDGRFLAHIFCGIYDQKLTVPFIKQTTGIQNLDVDAFLNQHWSMPDLDEQVCIRDAIDSEHDRTSLLRNYTTYQTFWRIEKAVNDDPT